MSLVVSVDVEDWPQSTWARSLPISDRARRNTERLLDIIARHHRKVTFFVLGKFAERFPGTVQRMAAEGHEVASHGYGHLEVFRQTRQAFRDDVRCAKQLLEDTSGQAVRGYRAPDFSITRDSLWALNVLAEEGFSYDSSVYPIRHGRYGIPDWPPQPVRVRLRSGGGIVELPIATIGAVSRRWPVGGGGYHRLLPWWVIRWSIRRTLASGQVYVAYCHPYEFDPGEFGALEFKVPVYTRLHQGLGRARFRVKFERMLELWPSETGQSQAEARSWPEHPV